ncbi:MAG: hypothetical protein ABIO70_31975 [Pseudomonadota bacterium]
MGERIEGVLRGAGVGSFDALVECTNVRPHPDDERLWIIGGRSPSATRTRGRGTSGR